MGLKKIAKHDPYTLSFVDENALTSNAEVVSIINKPILFRDENNNTWQTLTFTDDYRAPRPENAALGTAGDAVVLHGAQYPPGLYQGQRAPLLNFTDGTQRRPLGGYLTAPQGKAVTDLYIQVDPSGIDPVWHHVDFWAANGRPLQAGALLAGENPLTEGLSLNLGGMPSFAVLMQVQPLQWETPLRITLNSDNDTITLTLDYMKGILTNENSGIGIIREHRIEHYPFTLRIYGDNNTVHFEIGDCTCELQVNVTNYTELQASGAYYLVPIITLSKNTPIWPYDNHHTNDTLYAWYPLHALHSNDIITGGTTLSVAQFAIEAPADSFNAVVGVINPDMVDNNSIEADTYPFIFDALYPITESQPYKLRIYREPVETLRGSEKTYNGTINVAPGAITSLAHAFINANTLVVKDENGNVITDYTLDRLRGTITWGTDVTAGVYNITYNYYAWEYGFDPEVNRVYLGNNPNELVEVSIGDFAATNGLYGYLHLRHVLGDWQAYQLVYNNEPVTSFAHPTINGGFWTLKHPCYTKTAASLILKGAPDSKTILWLDRYQLSNGEPVCSLHDTEINYYDGTTQPATYNAIPTAAMPVLLAVTYIDTRAAGLAALSGFDCENWCYFDTTYHAAAPAAYETQPIRNIVPYKGEVYAAAGAKILAAHGWGNAGPQWYPTYTLPSEINVLDSDEDYIYAATINGVYKTDLTEHQRVTRITGCRLNVRGQKILISERRLLFFTKNWGVQRQRITGRAAPTDIQQQVGIAPIENGLLWANGYHTFLKTETYFEDLLYDPIGSRAIETSRDGIVYLLQGNFIRSNTGSRVYMGAVKDIHWVAPEDALEVTRPDGLYFLDKTTLTSKAGREPILFAVPVDALYIEGLLYILHRDKLTIHNAAALTAEPLVVKPLPLEGNDVAMRLVHVVYNHHPALLICARHSLYLLWLEDPGYTLHTLIPYRTRRYCAACGGVVGSTAPPPGDKDTNYYKCPNCGVIPESQTALITSENINAYPLLPDEPVVIGLPFWAPFLLEGVIGCNANDNQVYLVTRKRVIQYSWALPTPVSNDTPDEPA